MADGRPTALGDWALGCACGRCGRRNALFVEPAGQALGFAPVRGAFSFACAHCGSDNEAHAEALIRFRADPRARRVTEAA